MDDANKKLKIRKMLKEVVKTFSKCNATAEEEKLRSAYEALKRKINAVKTIEDEIIDISNDEKLFEDVIIIECNEFEIEAKSKLATLEELVRTQQPDVKNTRRNANVSMRLPKLEIPKFCGDAKKWHIEKSCSIMS